jgi:site-specific recombinase XerD
VEAFLAHMADRKDVPARARLRDALLFEIIARYGTRISETLGLNLDSLTVTAHAIDLRILGKGNKPRLVPLPLYDEKGKIEGRAAFRALLDEYLTKVRPRWKAGPGHEKALFLSQKGQRLSDDAARAVFNHAMQELGLKQFGYVVHSLRHSVASRLLNAGVGLPTVSRILGHASTQVTASIYAHSDVSEVEKGMTKTY